MELRRVRFLLILLMLMISLVSSLTIENVSAEARSYPDPAVTISIRKITRSAMVEPEYYKDGIVYIVGTVFVQIPWCPDIQYLVCEIEIDAGDWPVYFMYPLIFSKAQKQQSFTSMVSIPWNTPAGTNKTINFRARWSYVTYGKDHTQWGVTEPVSTNFRIPQFYNLDLSAPNYLEMKHGHHAGMNLLVENRGTGSDRPRIEISNLKKLTNNGFDIRLSQDKCSFPQDGAKNVSMSIGIEKWAQSGTHTMNVSVISAQAEGLGEVSPIRTEQILIRVKSPLDPYILYPVSILSIVIGLSILSAMAIKLADSSLRKRSKRTNKEE